jgi:hypothetical protein
MFCLRVVVLKPEQLPLLLPIQRNGLGQNAHRQAVGFVAVKYGLDDIRCKECQSKEPGSVGYVQPNGLSKPGYGGELA